MKGSAERCGCAAIADTRMLPSKKNEITRRWWHSGVFSWLESCNMSTLHLLPPLQSLEEKREAVEELLDRLALQPCRAVKIGRCAPSARDSLGYLMPVVAHACEPAARTTVAASMPTSRPLTAPILSRRAPLPPLQRPGAWHQRRPSQACEHWDRPHHQPPHSLSR